MWRPVGAGVSAIVLIGNITSVAASAGAVFGFLGPSIQISDDDHEKLDHREILLDMLPASGHEVAVMVAGAINVTPESFIEAIRHVDELQRGRLVPEVHRFSREPRIEDLSELTLDSGDIHEIEDCEPDDCGLKLSSDEITRLHKVRPIGAEKKEHAITREFRELLLEHARSYLRNGAAPTQSGFPRLLQHSFIRTRAPQVAAYFERYPDAPLPGSESFLYWSKATYAWKPLISISHVTIMRGSAANGWPDVLVASRDVYASRYTSGGFGLSMLFHDPQSPSHRYLVYVNRTWIDGLHWLWRPFVDHRIKSQAKKAFAAVRLRIEGGATRGAH